MSARHGRGNHDRPMMNECLFCEKPGNLVIDPDEDAYHSIKSVADERQDAIRDKFYFLYNDSLIRQCFSWHVKCATAYICYVDHNPQAKARKVPKQEVKKEEPEEEVKIKIEGVSATPEVPNSLKRASSSSAELARCLICNKRLNVVLSKAPSTCYRLSAAKLIYDTAHANQDGVYLKICSYSSPEDLIYKGMYYHKECYVRYVYPNKSEKQRSGKLTQENIINGMKKLLDEVDLTTNYFALSYLAKRMAALTDVKDAIIEPETVKSLLVAKYGERLLFSYPDGVEFGVVFLSGVPLSEVTSRLR